MPPIRLSIIRQPLNVQNIERKRGNFSRNDDRDLLKRHPESSQLSIALLEMTEKPKGHKTILLGPESVGKTSIICRYVANEFDGSIPNSVGVAYTSQIVLVRGEPIPLEIWDTAGQERYMSINQLHFRGAEAAILVFTIVDSASLNKLTEWISILEQNTNPLPALFLVGNMTDREDERAVDPEVGQAFAQTHNAVYREVSAKTGEGIIDLFETVAEKCRDGTTTRKGTSTTVSLEEIASGDQGGCKC
jgi:Ras-related protein Rab-5C